MESLKLLEELNKKLIDANKRADIVFENVGEQDKVRSDIDHELLNNYHKLSAKQKREYTEKYFECLAKRHDEKYEYRELMILKELYNNLGVQKAFNEALSKLRKLNKEIESPIYYKRAKENAGEIIKVETI